MLSRTRVTSTSDAGREAAAAPTHVLYRDFETRGVISLKRAGAHKYAADPGTEVVCAAYAVDDEPVQIWTPSDPIPSEVTEAANNPDYLVVAHGPFELVIEQNNLGPRFGWPQASLSRQRCAMTLALAHSLPGSLEMAAKALRLTHQKDKAGQRLMMQMAKPRRARKSEDPARVYFFDDDARKRRLHAYCMYDVQFFVSCINGCARCRRLSRNFGSWISRSTAADLCGSRSCRSGPSNC